MNAVFYVHFPENDTKEYFRYDNFIRTREFGRSFYVLVLFVSNSICIDALGRADFIRFAALNTTFFFFFFFGIYAEQAEY